MDPRFFLPCFHGPRALLAVRTSHSANKRYVMDSWLYWISVSTVRTVSCVSYDLVLSPETTPCSSGTMSFFWE